MKSYKQVRQEMTGDQEEDHSRDNDRFNCGFCGRPTTRAAMSAYGARCFPCFEAYCNAPQPSADRSPAAIKWWADVEAHRGRFGPTGVDNG
jgi:hypothetical protein